MSNNEAQTDEGQLIIPVGTADITGMSDEDISAKIDSDASFAKSYMSGKIVNNTAPAEAVAPVEPVAVTPAEPVSEPKPEPVVESKNVFTIKADVFRKGTIPQGKFSKVCGTNRITSTKFTPESRPEMAVSRNSKNSSEPRKPKSKKNRKPK